MVSQRSPPHAFSAPRLSFSLSLSLASTSLSPGKEATFSSLLAPGLASGQRRPRGGEPRARRSAFVVEGSRLPRDSSTHLPWLLSPLELRSTSSCSSRCAPRPLSLPTPNPLGFSARANKGNLHGGPPTKINGQPPPAGNVIFPYGKQQHSPWKNESTKLSSSRS